jgi:hypothetical protein
MELFRFMHRMYGEKMHDHPPFPGGWAQQPDWFLHDYAILSWRLQCAEEWVKPGL